MTRRARTAVTLLAAVAWSACDRPDVPGDRVPEAPAAAVSALDSAALAAVDYMNQFSETGFARPGATIVQDEGRLVVEQIATAIGDADGDAEDEAVVVLSTTAGGTGVFFDLALVDVRGGIPRNVATLFLGDRIRVHSVSIAEGEIRLAATIHTPADPACCPSLRVTRRFVWNKGGLVEVDFPEDALRYDPPMGEPAE